MNFWDDLREQRQEALSQLNAVLARQKLLVKQKGLCYWCNLRMVPFDRTLDHLLPHSLGGPYVLANLVLACRDCNERRGSRFSPTWLERLPDAVLALAIENLQAVAAETYEATSLNQASVLQLRQEMKDRLWELLISRLAARHASLEAEQEPKREQRRQIERQHQHQRDETSFHKLADQLWATKVGQVILRYEKQHRLAPVLRRAGTETVVRRRKAQA